MTDQELIDLKNKIEEKKTELAELKGRKKEMMTSLKKDYNCSSVTEAEALIEDLKTQASDLEEKKQTLIDELEEKYDL